jgi:NAD(P)-dependent dehydrogenase (short-subunit alcohol dehydrogenase family)
MSFAQKEWLGRGGIQMSNISAVNSANRLGKPLQGAVALVTGGSRGIGKAIARQLAALGAAVGICGRDEEKLIFAARELEAAGAEVLARRADVTKETEIRAFVEAAEKQFGGITVLVNNAGTGGGGFGAIQEKSEEEWDQVMNTNLKSVFFASRAVIPGMIQRHGGDIINISSLAGKNTFAGGGIYCASKWGVIGLSGCMAEDLRDKGIRVTVICPGSVATEFSGRGPKEEGKALHPEDVAHAVEGVVTQSAGSFLSEIQLRPLRRA